MIKEYCDKCGKETKNNMVGNDNTFESGGVAFRITIAIGGIWNNGCLCRDCMIKLITLAKEKRPK